MNFSFFRQAKAIRLKIDNVDNFKKINEFIKKFFFYFAFLKFLIENMIYFFNR